MQDVDSYKSNKHAAYTYMDMGYLNDAIEGYLVEVLRRTNHWNSEIEDALDILPHVLDTISAEDAEDIAKNWRR